LIFAARSLRQASSNSCSQSASCPSPWILPTPFLLNSTFEAKKSQPYSVNNESPKGQYGGKGLAGKRDMHLVGVEITLDKGGDDDARFTIHSTKEGIGKFGGCPSHTQSSTASTIFRLDNLVPTELNSLDQCCSFVAFSSV